MGSFIIYLPTSMIWRIMLSPASSQLDKLIGLIGKQKLLMLKHFVHICSGNLLKLSNIPWITPHSGEGMFHMELTRRHISLYSQQQMSVAAMKQLQQILFTLTLLQLMMALPVLNFMLVWFLFTIV